VRRRKRRVGVTHSSFQRHDHLIAQKIDEDAVNPTALSHEEIVSKIVTAIAAAMKVLEELRGCTTFPVC
jgi:hypothetical protein